MATTATPASKTRRRIRSLSRCRWLALGLCVAWVIGQVWRDQAWLTGLCFYIPSPLLGAGCVLLMLIHFDQRRFRYTFALLAVPPGLMTLFVENAPPSPQPTQKTGLRIVHWNIGGRLDLDRQGAVLQDHHADLYVLSETPKGDAVEEFRAALGEAYQARTFSNLAVVGRGEITALDWLIDEGRFKVQHVVWRHANKTWSLFVVDCPSNITIHRDPLLRRVNHLIFEHRPDLIIGDFNAPRRSNALASLPVGYRHAYDTVGSGVGYTWPAPLPMYAIDHVIHAPTVRPKHYKLFSSWASDHRLQVFEMYASTP